MATLYIHYKDNLTNKNNAMQYVYIICKSAHTHTDTHTHIYIS